MSASPKSIRRWLGGICLGLALLLLVLGQTVLKAWLAGSAVAMLVYWMTCFILAALAAAVAIIDAARVQQETREEQRSLIESTISDIEREQRKPREPRQ